MNAAIILHFTLMDPLVPAMTCNVCGEIASQNNPDRKIAELFPFEDVHQSCVFVVCSKKCHKALLTHPTLDHFILRCLSDAAELHKLRLSDRFQKWSEEVNRHIQNN